jgi:hypothetical protein
MSGNVAVVVPVCDVTVSTTLVKVTSMSVDLWPGGHGENCDTSIGFVSTSNDPLPDLVSNVCEPTVSVNDLTKPGGWFPPLFVQVLTISTSALSVAVAVGPAPATSPVAVRNAVLVDLVAVTSGCPTKCSPPLRVVDVGPTANAPVDIIAGASSIIAVAIVACQAKFLSKYARLVA